MTIMANTKTQADKTARSSSRTLNGLEKNFKDVLIADGVAFVTVAGDIKTVKRQIVEQSGLRANKRTNFNKQAYDLTLKVLRSLLNLKGKHLEIRFLREEGGKVYDEHGKDVIRYHPTGA